MSETSANAAMDRIERAIVRIERALAARDQAHAARAEAYARLDSRHAILRDRVQDSIAQLDSLIAEGAAEGPR